MVTVSQKFWYVPAIVKVKADNTATDGMFVSMTAKCMMYGVMKFWDVDEAEAFLELLAGYVKRNEDDDRQAVLFMIPDGVFKYHSELLDREPCELFIIR